MNERKRKTFLFSDSFEPYIGRRTEKQVTLFRHAKLHSMKTSVMKNVQNRNDWSYQMELTAPNRVAVWNRLSFAFDFAIKNRSLFLRNVSWWSFNEILINYLATDAISAAESVWTKFISSSFAHINLSLLKFRVSFVQLARKHRETIWPMPNLHFEYSAEFICILI